MQDIDVKRDARRRRILENSERRLLKITGRNNDIESEESTTQLFINNDIQKDIILSNMNDEIPVTDRCSKRNKDANVFVYGNAWNGTSNTSKCKYDNIKSETENIHGILTQTKSLPILLLTNRVNYILLAIVVNILLALELDHLFGKTITIPCFSMMLGRIYSHKNIWVAQESNLFYTALILCNIKPELIYQFKRFISLILMILEDLALYIFSFTLIHYGLFCYLHKMDIATTLNA